MRTLKLLNLHCDKTYDDNTKVDETFLPVGNKFQGFELESMRNRSVWKVNAGNF